MSSSLAVNDVVYSSLEFFHKTDDGQIPFVRLFDDGSGTPYSNYELEERVVKIENIRGTEHLYTLDTSGFQFFRCDTRHPTFATKEEFEREYMTEAVKLTQSVTGAHKIVPFELVRRRNTHKLDTTITQPVKYAHIDQTPRGALGRARQFVPADEVDALLKGRYQIINLWRPITHAAFDRPLAVCDYRSVDSDTDLTPWQLIYSDRVGEPYLMKYNPRHEWKYLRGMDTGEVLLFKWLVAACHRKTFPNAHIPAMTLLKRPVLPNSLLTPPLRIQLRQIQCPRESLLK